MSQAITDLNLGELTKHASGKVREIFDMGDKLLFVATDRLSAFDVVLPQGIPGKGKVLNQISIFWFDQIADLVDNHLITASFDEFPAELQHYRSQLEGRSMIVKKAEVFPVECIVRGYIVGSGWKDYQRTGTVSGLPLPEGLQLCDKLEEPIFTPSTKAVDGHDENISYEQMVEIIGGDWAKKLKDVSLAVYSRARDIAAEKGIIIADTKFEFGLVDGKLTLVDEVLTPDSSRFWPMDTYEPGKNQPSYDKQYVRDYLETLDWDKNPPAPELPVEIINGTSQRYKEAFEALTGSSLKE
jgi:phosphoribosylaminoimidazole-succinocarboxamide synthase